MSDVRKCECGYDIADAGPGIGDYCTNNQCPIESKICKDWEEQEVQKLKDFISQLQAKMEWHQYPHMSEGMQALLESEIREFKDPT